MYHGTHESFQRNLIMGGASALLPFANGNFLCMIDSKTDRHRKLAHRPLEVKCVGALKERKKGRKKERNKETL